MLIILTAQLLLLLLSSFQSAHTCLLLVQSHTVLSALPTQSPSLPHGHVKIQTFYLLCETWAKQGKIQTFICWSSNTGLSMDSSALHHDWFFGQPQTEVSEQEIPKKACKAREDFVLQLPASITEALIATLCRKRRGPVLHCRLQHRKWYFLSPALLGFPSLVNSLVFLYLLQGSYDEGCSKLLSPFPQERFFRTTVPLAMVKAFRILLAHHLHCYLAGKDMFPGKPQQRSVGVSSRREESNGKETHTTIKNNQLTQASPSTSCFRYSPDTCSPCHTKSILARKFFFSLLCAQKAKINISLKTDWDGY